MKAIIIGAGRGQRLMPSTAEAPKCFAEVGGRRILEWAIEAFVDNDIDRICFIGGYRIESVKTAYPRFDFKHNVDWENNNILASLMHAEAEMDGGFICCYSDILFTGRVIDRCLKSTVDISLVVDTEWLDRYRHRMNHPSDDAEKVTVANGLVTRIHRAIAESDAHGEFVGVARFSAAGARQLRDHYHRARTEYAGRPYREAAQFEKAYLIQMLQDMIESGVTMHHIDTAGEYMEIDTQEDFELARRDWGVLGTHEES